MKLLLIDLFALFSTWSRGFRMLYKLWLFLSISPHFPSWVDWEAEVQDAIRFGVLFAAARGGSLSSLLTFDVFEPIDILLSVACPSLRIPSCAPASQCVLYYWSSVEYIHVCLTCVSSTSHAVLIKRLFDCLFACEYICTHVCLYTHVRSCGAVLDWREGRGETCGLSQVLYRSAGTGGCGRDEYGWYCRW